MSWSLRAGLPHLGLIHELTGSVKMRSSMELDLCGVSILVGPPHLRRCQFWSIAVRSMSWLAIPHPTRYPRPNHPSIDRHSESRSALNQDDERQLLQTRELLAKLLGRRRKWQRRLVHQPSPKAHRFTHRGLILRVCAGRAGESLIRQRNR